MILLFINLFFNKLLIEEAEEMERTTLLDIDALTLLGFKYDGNFWRYSQEEQFAIKLEPNCFYVSFHGYLAKHPYDLTVGELERLFYDRTGRLFY